MGGQITRLLFVTSFYPPLTGGAASRIQDFARLLHVRGFNVAVLTFLPIKRFFGAKQAMNEQVRVFRLPSIGFKHPFDQILIGAMGTLLLSLIFNPHLVVYSVPPGEPALGAFLVGEILGKKMVADVRDEWEDAVLRRTKRVLTRQLYRLYKPLFNAIYQKSHFVITVTPGLVRRLKHNGVREIFLLPNGADVRLFHPTSFEECRKIRKTIGLRNEDFVFVYAGAVGWYYKLDVVVKALQILLAEHQLDNFKLLIVGGGDKNREYKELTRQLGLRENVLFLDERPRAEVAKILPCCDVGVIPFDDDPIWFSAYTTKIFEYAASGLPTIAAIAKGADLERLILENKIGLVVEPLEIEQMAEAMKRIRNDKKALEAMRTNARKLAVERFNREEIARRLADLLLTKS